MSDWYKFGTTLHNTIDDLFAFVMNPRVSTNNEEVRSLRNVMIHRKIRQGIDTPERMRTFRILMM